MKFKGMTYAERVEAVQTHKVCMCCLRVGHTMRTCRSTKTCSEGECIRRHHPLLHSVERPVVRKDRPFARASFVGPKPLELWTPLERGAEELMKVSHVPAETGGYFTARIPWRDRHHELLRDNYRAVLEQQVASHSRGSLQKRGVELREVSAIVATYLLKGYIEEVPRGEETSGWYLPFSEVVNRAESVPVKLVFDAKAEYGGVSLNQQVLDTPNRLNDLTKILTRFRRFRYTFAGGVTEMLLQIRLHTEDQVYHRFTHNARSYQFTRVLVSNKSSLNLSQKVLEALCSVAADFAEAKDTLENSCRMGDCADSRPTEEELRALVVELPGLLARGGMRISRVHSNSPKALESLDPLVTSRGVSFNEEEAICYNSKVLSMVYDASPDCFTYSVRFSTVQEWKDSLCISAWTRRAALETAASHHDPLGFATPITVQRRKFLRGLCQEGGRWDDPLNKVLSKRWEAILGELIRLKNFTLPRCLIPRGSDAPEIHIFCDASEDTYTCALYARVVIDGRPFVNLLSGKARVTPIKAPSVARLGLDACLLGVRMGKWYAEILNTKDLYYYTSSRIALYWIESHPPNLEAYAERRVAEILAHSIEKRWAQSSGVNNPASVPNRPVLVADLMGNGVWAKGPDFLHRKDFRFPPLRRGGQPRGEHGGGSPRGSQFGGSLRHQLRKK